MADCAVSMPRDSTNYDDSMQFSISKGSIEIGTHAFVMLFLINIFVSEQIRSHTVSVQINTNKL